MDTLRSGSCTLRLIQGDITQQEVAAIVNAANSTLLGGGGVDGAIHRSGGPAILLECKRIRATSHPDGLPTGEVVSTTAGALPAQRVLHTVGPVWRGGRHGEREQLASAYRNTLDRARAEGLRTVAFPSLSTGAYGYPIEAAADVALSTVCEVLRAHGRAFDEVRFVLFSDRDLQTYRHALARIASG
jgi:O-acetyl-ADP-ribose deacetylase (regulator of RNase III)